VNATRDGYVVDVAYPGHFHRETMPLWLHATATALGFGAPDPARSYRWCELGCGGGLNTLLAAATNPLGEFVGVDFNAAQLEPARNAASDARLANVEFVAADVDMFARGQPAAGFDFIVLHGIWSWVSRETQLALRNAVARLLRPGGIAYVGYMCHPGASSMAAIGKLLREHARHLPGSSADKVRAGLRLLRDLADAGSGFVAEHPGIARQIEAMEREPAGYLAHEFLSDHWQPQHAADTIRDFAAAGCGWIGSAVPLENIDALSVPGNVQPLLRGLPSAPLAETVRDLARNQSQRRDLFQRDPAPLSPQRHIAALDAIAFAALPGAPRAGGLTFDTRIGPVPGPAEIFDPLLRALAEGPRRFGELRRLPAFTDAPGLLNQALQALTWSGCAHPLRGDDAPAPSCDAIDALLRESAAVAPRGRWRTAPTFGTALPATTP